MSRKAHLFYGGNMKKKTKVLGLFQSVKNTNKTDSSYELVQSKLDERATLGTNDLTIISKWYKARYEKTYGIPMIGYNFFNCRSTVKILGEKYGCSNWEVCKLINNWFNLFHSLEYDKIASDDTLTLSILKTGWIVDGLYNKRRPNESKRNSSFKTHGQSRRLSNNNELRPNKGQISNKGF